eukprot:2993181-Pyramimonas_sp.AAC.1
MQRRMDLLAEQLAEVTKSESEARTESAVLRAHADHLSSDVPNLAGKLLVQGMERELGLLKQHCRQVCRPGIHQ